MSVQKNNKALEWSYTQIITESTDPILVGLVKPLVGLRIDNENFIYFTG